MSPQELTPLRLALDDAVDSRRARIRGAANDGRISQDYERVFDQYVNLWTDYPAARRIAFDPRLAKAPAGRHRRVKNSGFHRSRSYFGSPSAPLRTNGAGTGSGRYHDHAMIKPPGERSKPTNWHQDAPYWAMDPAARCRPGSRSTT